MSTITEVFRPSTTQATPIADMPAGLAAAVGQLDEPLAEVAISNWQATDAYGRGHYRAYISVARTKRGGRKRCEIAAQQLVDPFAASKLAGHAA